MLTMNEISKSNTMADTKINEQLRSAQKEYYFMTKRECDVGETSMEEVDEMDSMDSMDTERHGDAVYYEDCMKSTEDSIDDFDPDINKMLKKKIKYEWDEDLDEESYRSEENSRENLEDGEEDEQTIATFITSTGQQLALYAVEDSDEVFAVAEYDESGKTPTDFQFLMKSDVEKLIGEGAVRTVRKPAPIKKQTPPENEVERNIISNKPQRYNDKTRVNEEMMTINVRKSPENRQREDKMEVSDIENDLNFQQLMDVSYVMEDNQELIQSNVAVQPDEVVEESTVQNIFHEDDQSDSELTFDEIEKSLASFRRSPPKSRSILKKSFEPPSKHPERQNINGTITPSDSFEISSPLIQSPTEKPGRKVLNNVSTLKSKHIPRALLGRKEKSEPRPTVFIHGSTALICCPIEEVEPELKIAKESPEHPAFKIKRPRKQQLTTVDRADSEIIIQPASLVEEPEEIPAPKKRGRRKKKRQEFPIKNHLKTRSKRTRIEVIEIDVEDEERHIEEITIDDNKEKESSDKENEVIMVDSDEEDLQEEKQNSLIFKCEYCARSFRQKRALDTHARVCPKSPTSRRRIEKGTRSRSNDSSSNLPKKQYVCKICADKFDVVVALARHVRSQHKKKVAPSIESQENDEVVQKKATNVKEKERRSVMEKNKVVSIQRKDKNKIRQLWKTKRMCCTDCGRWFASSALLSAHCLQHETKNSEKQIKRCQLCRKLFRSTLIYMRHMKMHNKVNKLQKSLRRTRQSASKIATLRKRVRSKKL